MLSLRKLVFASAILAVAPFAISAEEPKAAPVKVDVKAAEPKAMPAVATPAPAVVSSSTGACASPAPAACAPAPACTVKRTVMVPTQVEETRTVMRPVTKTETYTAYKHETVQEKKWVDVTTYKTVTETVMEPRTTCVKVPVWEDKCVTECRKKIEWVTECKETCKLAFVKECKTIGGGCSDPCDPCAKPGHSISFSVCKPTLVKDTVQVCRPKCVTEQVQVVKKVCTYRTETQTTMVPVCKTKCVPCVEKKEIVECKKVCVPYTATRNVTTCEAVCEKVMVCKMVATIVEEPVPACGNGCGNGNACGNGSACGAPAGDACGAPACGTPACGGDACGSSSCGGDSCGSKGHGCFKLPTLCLPKLHCPTISLPKLHCPTFSLPSFGHGHGCAPAAPSCGGCN